MRYIILALFLLIYATTLSAQSVNIATGAMVTQDLGSYTLGGNLVVDGSFSNISTNWNYQEVYNYGIASDTVWTMVSGGVNQKASRRIAGIRDRLTQVVTLENNALYKVTWTVSNYVAGGIAIDVGGSFTKIATENGTFTDYVIAYSDDLVSLQAAPGCNMTISGLEVRRAIAPAVTVPGKLTANEGLKTNGSIETENNHRILIGSWKNGVQFGVNPWHPNETNQPSVSIGQEAMPFGTGVAIGPNAGKAANSTSYITAVGINALLRNTTGHATAMGTGAAQSNTTGDVAVFGDEALAYAVATNNNAFGYYTLNLTTSDSSAAFGHQAGRFNVTGHRTVFGYGAFKNGSSGHGTGLGLLIGESMSSGRITGVGSYFGRNCTTCEITGIGYGAAQYTTQAKRITFLGDYTGGTVTTSPATDSLGLFVGYNARRSVPSSTRLVNYAAIGPESTVNESNLMAFGNSGIEKNEFFGNIGINADANALIRGTSNKNSTQGIVIDNPNTGSAASIGLTTTTNAGSVNILSHSVAHSAWPATFLISVGTNYTGGTQIYQSGNNPFRIWTNNIRRFGIDNNGNVTIGASTSNSQKLTVEGDMKVNTINSGTLTRFWGDTGDGILKHQPVQIASGTWTPTISTTSNDTVSVTQAMYTRVNNLVNFTMQIELKINPVAGGSTYFFTLPIASAFTVSTDAIATVTRERLTGISPGDDIDGAEKSLLADTANDRLQLFIDNFDNYNSIVTVNGTYIIK